MKFAQRLPIKTETEIYPLNVPTKRLLRCAPANYEEQESWNHSNR